MTDKPVPDDEGNFIRTMQRLRERKGWTQGEFARRMQESGWTSFHQTTVSRLEKGERPVRLGEARAIARILDTALDNMIAGDGFQKQFDELWDQFQRLGDLGTRLQETAEEYEDQRSIVEELLDKLRPVFEAQEVDESVPHDAVNMQIQKDVIEWAEEEVVFDAVRYLALFQEGDDGINPEAQ